jgi:hypothetical protein
MAVPMTVASIEQGSNKAQKLEGVEAHSCTHMQPARWPAQCTHLVSTKHTLNITTGKDMQALLNSDKF